jgi:hypothetical protein
VFQVIREIGPIAQAVLLETLGHPATIKSAIGIDARWSTRCLQAPGCYTQFLASVYSQWQ